MTDYEYILKENFGTLIRGDLTTGTIIRKRNPDLTRDPRLIQFCQGSSYDLRLTIILGGIKTCISSNPKYNSKIQIFNFTPEWDNTAKIQYLVDFSNVRRRRFLDMVKLLESHQEDLMADLLIVSKYFSEVDIRKVYQETHRVNLHNYSSHFKRLTQVFHRCVTKPNNYKELLIINNWELYIYDKHSDEDLIFLDMSKILGK